MPLPKEQTYTVKDIYDLPNGQRAELIDGIMYDMAPPTFQHQKLVSELHYSFKDFVRSHSGSCEVLPAPFAVFLTADDKTYVEPDISVICDRNKISDRGCEGAPDLVIEVVSPSSRKMDYTIKNTIYAESGVREYWIVDPAKERTAVYQYEMMWLPPIFPLIRQ